MKCSSLYFDQDTIYDWEKVQLLGYYEKYDTIFSYNHPLGPPNAADMSVGFFYSILPPREQVSQVSVPHLSPPIVWVSAVRCPVQGKS